MQPASHHYHTRSALLHSHHSNLQQLVAAGCDGWQFCLHGVQDVRFFTQGCCPVRGVGSNRGCVVSCACYKILAVDLQIMLSFLGVSCIVPSLAVPDLCQFVLETCSDQRKVNGLGQHGHCCQ